ncbi:MAG: glycosyltransferase family 2 protein, partial [Acidobacteriota bacterium]|nr:glycosyltransferase family 2 protein [Acidobacteriota bacterium]
MIANPAYGTLGLFAFPYFVLFEMLGPLVEISGYLLTTLGFCFGLFDWNVVILFLVASLLYGMVLSTASVILEELSTRRYPQVRTMMIMIASAIIENLGFRQLLTIWRAQAFVDLLRGNRSWGAMERTGFQKPALPPIA